MHKTFKTTFRIIYLILVIIFCLSFVKVNASSTSIIMDTGASIRLNNPQGIKFSANVSGFSESAEYGFFLGKGELTVKAIKNKTKVSVDNNDGKIAISIINIPESGLTQDISALAYVYDGGEYYYADRVETRNIFEVAYAMHEDINYSSIDFIDGIIDDVDINVTYDFGYEVQFQTKDDIRRAYYLDLYNFIVSKEAPELVTYNINNYNDFLDFMDTFYYKDRNEMGTIGTAFASYYLSQDIGGVLEDQPNTKFLGWCYENNKWIDLIHHLEEFFAYWRTDEGYSATDPNGNDFYASNWASLVDTAKFFYFDGETLNTRYGGIYSWFNSDRVDEKLNYLPGVGYTKLTYHSTSAITLPTAVKREGYEFLGWYDNNDNLVTVANQTMTVHAKWQKEGSIDVSAIANEFIKDFNDLNSTHVTYQNFDTSKMESSWLVAFGENEEMTEKWMWLYKGICDANNDTSKYPDSVGFSWATYKGFYLANLNGFFNGTVHKDSGLGNTSADYSQSINTLTVLEKRIDMISEYASEFISEFNSVCGTSLGTCANIDTNYLGSSVIDKFALDTDFVNKWMWVFEGICEVTNQPSRLPSADGFEWSNNRGFYLANLNGFFTKSQHTDTYLGTVSANYSLLINELTVLNSQYN